MWFKKVAQTRRKRQFVGATNGETREMYLQLKTLNIQYASNPQTKIMLQTIG